MFSAMDGLRVSLVNQQQSQCDNRSKPVDVDDKDRKKGSVSQKDIDEDIGENSNGSGNETGRDDEITRLVRGGPLLTSNLTSRHYHHSRHTPSNTHTSSNNHNNTSRAHYCQFETPADETRGTFPDDFDEELFINSGQLEEGTGEDEVRDGFDEEMESSQAEDHHHPLTLDTADHSESSDIEEIMYSSTETTPTGGGSDIPGSSLNKRHPLPIRPLGQGSPHLPEPMQQDLSTRSSNYNHNNEEEEEDISNSRMDVLLHGNDESEDNENDAALLYNSDDPEHNTGSSSSISPLRKRKGDAETESLDETLPAKKSVKEEMMVDEMNFSPILDSPDTIEDVIDIKVHEKSRTTRPVIPTKDNPPPQMDEWLTIFMGWSHAERLMAINELIHVCEPTQVRHMMQVIEPQFQRDFISLLPKELALYVLSFLEPKDLLRAAQTCRYWRILCDDNLLWREKCREAGIGYFSAMSQRIHSKRSRGNQPSCPGTNCAGAASNCISNTNGSESPSSCNISRWKAAFLRQHNVEANWRFRPMRPTKVLKGHDDHVITCLQFSSNRIVSGSDDNTLKVWSATTGKCLRTLIGHTGGVWSSQMSGTTIVSGSTDRTLRVWNADTGAITHTLYGHTSTVRCMHLCGRKVVSGSRDATLRVWDVDSGECLHVLVGHMAAVRCVQYNGTIVVSGAYDYMVRVWDVEREECLHQLNGHTNRVYSLQFDGIHVVSGSLDTSIRVWDVKTGVCKHTLMGHQSLTSGMELRENLLVSGNADSTVKIWDINTGQCLLTLSGPNKHLSAVTCLQLINKFVITSSDDGTVKLWDIRTGEFVRNLVTLSSGGSGGVVWRIRASETKLVCAVGSRNGTEETKLLVLDFDVEASK